MADITHNDPLVTESKLTEFYSNIKPYLGGSVSTGFTPVGTIISIMSNHAPAGYLICDGTIYNIADYKELANHFFTEFGSTNYFGGDGTTTFKVPDLRGEFLRGTGTNSHTDQGSGSAVGTHQDATKEVDIFTVSDTGAATTKEKAIETGNADSWTGSSTKYYCTKSASMYEGTFTDRSRSTHHTTRPTNTAVLYCIATHNMFMNEGSNYSTDEQIIGTWIDGKPIYQKTFFVDDPSVGTWVNVANIDISTFEIINIQGSLRFVKGGNNFNMNVPYDGGDIGVKINRNNGNLPCYITASSVTNLKIYVTIQYTKTTD